MSEIILYAAPGSCAFVPTIALEEIGVPFDYRLIRFARGEHKSPAFKQVNPAGKVPAFSIDGEVLTENVAILGYLNERFPEARLLPAASDAMKRARQTADLCYVSSTLHPMMTRLRMPMFFAGPENNEAVVRMVTQALPEYLQVVEDRLGHQWWYGDQWSAVDAYLYWAFRRVEGGKFDLTPYPKYRDHAARMSKRPATQRAEAREAEAMKQLESEGLGGPPPRR